jgi:putative SOS response-associated peptidase YedK
MRWGLIPSFAGADDKPDFYRMFNARRESVADKPAFARLLARRRCVCIVDGFYEFKETMCSSGRVRKLPVFVRRADGQPMLLAGVFDTWRPSAEQRAELNDRDAARRAALGPLARAFSAGDSVGDELAPAAADGGADAAAEDAGDEAEVHSFAILTTQSANSIAWLHDREPVILATRAAAAAWLDSSRSLADLAARDPGVIAPLGDGDDKLAWHYCDARGCDQGYQQRDVCNVVDPMAGVRTVSSMFAAAVASPSRGSAGSAAGAGSAPSPGSAKRAREEPDVEVVDLSSAPVVAPAADGGGDSDDVKIVGHASPPRRAAPKQRRLEAFFTRPK